MDKKKYPLLETEDSLGSTVSSCDMTGFEPVLPKGEAEAESYSELGNTPGELL